MRQRVWRWVGMHKDDRAAAFEFLEDGLQSRVSQIHAVGVREKNNTIQSEDVNCIRQLLQRRINIRERDASETGKPVRSCMDKFRRDFVAPARQRPSLPAI